MQLIRFVPIVYRMHPCPLTREQFRIDVLHVRDVLTNKMGLQLKQVQEHVEHVNERTDALLGLRESKLHELHSSFGIHMEQRLKAAFDTMNPRVDSSVQACLGEHLKALNTCIDDSIRNNESPFYSFNSHLNQRIGKSLSQAGNTIAKRSV